MSEITLSDEQHAGVKRIVDWYRNETHHQQVARGPVADEIEERRDLGPRIASDAAHAAGAVVPVGWEDAAATYRRFSETPTTELWRRNGLALSGAAPPSPGPIARPSAPPGRSRPTSPEENRQS